MIVMKTTLGPDVDADALENYLKSLVNCIFKILPMREHDEETLPVYIESLMFELLGCHSLVCAIHGDRMFLGIVSTLEYLRSHTDQDSAVFRREVFKAISYCNKLTAKYVHERGDANGRMG